MIDPDAVPKIAAARVTYLQNPANWRASSEYGGSAGAAGIGPLSGVVINEVLSHTDIPSFDSIELYNTTDAAIDVGGWYLSDSNENLQKYRIPDGTMIGSHQYLVFTEQQFGVSAYSSATEGGDGSAESLEAGTTLLLSENTWRKIVFPYTVTTNTVLEFDYLSTRQGEWQGIGLDNDDSSSPDRLFRLYGSETWGISSYADYASSQPGWKHYAIPVGAFYTGAMNYLAFINDDDASDKATSYFKNVMVHDGAAGAAIDFRRYFSLSSNGDNLWLMKADASGKITYFADNVSFGAAINGESFGRWPNGTGILYPMKNRTFGDANDAGGNGPRIGPLVISEVMYRPTASGNEIADDFEYLEIFNPTNAAVSLADWRLGAGIEFAFASTTTLGAHEAAVVLTFDPSLAENATKLANFKAKYGVGDSVKLLGPYFGRLSDTGGKVQLLRPGDPEGTPPSYPALLEDEVAYGIASPWPASANGGGYSLQRLTADSWGDFASSWTAATPNVGTAKLSSVAGRWIFYDNSAYDGRVAGVNGADDLAIAVDKRALLPGQTATFANYTNYSRGINGLMVDFRFPTNGTQISLADFEFRVGNDNDPSHWTLLAGAQLPALTVRPGAGVDGTVRVELVWNDASAIKNQWLQVTVLATDHTGLRAADSFYFGNAVGETGNVPGEAIVNVLDEQQARSHRGNFTLVDIASAYDFNRDRKVNAADEFIARENSGTSLFVLSISAPAAAAAESSAASVVPPEENEEPSAPENAVAVDVPPTGIPVSSEETPPAVNAVSAPAENTRTSSEAISTAPSTDEAKNSSVESIPADDSAFVAVPAIAATEPESSVAVASAVSTETVDAEPIVTKLAIYAEYRPQAATAVISASARAAFFASDAETSKKTSKSAAKWIESPRWELPESPKPAKVEPAAIHHALDSLLMDEDPFHLGILGKKKNK